MANGESPTVRWRGFNLPDLMFFEAGKPLAFQESDFRQIAAWGFNFVRLPMTYEVWVDPQDWTKVQEERLAPVDEAVAWGQHYGLHVCLNFHRAPGHCINPPAEPKSLWADEDAVVACAAHWAAFARHYRGVPSDALSFNLLNEPSQGVSERVYREVVVRLVAAIRLEDPDRPILVDGLDVGRRPSLSLARMEPARPLIQSTRGYAPFALTHYLADWAPGNDRRPVWPPLGQANAFLYGPWKPELCEPLVLEGPFPEGVLRLTVGKVSDFVSLHVRFDGRPVLDEDFLAVKGGGVAEPEYQSQWRIYHTDYRRPVDVPVPEGVRMIRVEVGNGDWLTLDGVEFIDRHGQRALLAMVSEWGRRQPGVRLDGMTLRADSEASDAWLRRELLEPWEPALRAGIPVFVGEWGVYNKTPHDVALRWMEDCLRLWKEQGWGWALWNFRGPFGVLDSDRPDVEYVPHAGHRLDARMLELLQRY